MVMLCDLVGSTALSARFDPEDLREERVEDTSERFSAYCGLWVGHLTRCEPVPMRQLAKLFLRETTARPDCPEAVIVAPQCRHHQRRRGHGDGAADELWRPVYQRDPLFWPISEVVCDPAASVSGHERCCRPGLCDPASRRTTPLQRLIERDFKDVGQPEKRQIVRENITQLYGFDLD